jgi:RepB DNA-primase from phage plasmid
MLDRGFFLTRQAVRRQLAAMPHPIYLVRLIHHATHRAFPGERLWTAGQLSSASTLRFLRLRNREGCDIYIQPYAGDHNAGYILLDVDAPQPSVLQALRTQGLPPCVVLKTSPGHLQAWLHLSERPLEPALATAVARQLAHTYAGDLASAEGRHLGRLAGFTNQKPERRTPRGYSPWVTLLHARSGLASRAEQLLQSVTPTSWTSATPQPTLAPAEIAAGDALRIYCQYVRQWRIAERFPHPDWSIVDLWVARELLAHGRPPAHVQAILQFGSPGFPRRHGNPSDYLRRTLRRAAFSLPLPPRPVCVTHTDSWVLAG